MAQSLPKTFKAMVFKSQGANLTMEEFPLNEPGEGEIVIKVHACGVCHSDTLTQSGLMGGGFPLIPGHEMIGTVAAVGPGEKRWKVGDRVGGPWHGGHDGTCKACRRGLYQICENERINGVNRNGGYAEYCTLRTEAVVSIPKDVDPSEFAPFLCAGVTTFNGVRKMGIQPGGIVAIQGLGGLGHLCLQFCAKMGYNVVALSSSASKEKFAKDLGASHYVDGSKEDTSVALQKLGGADLIVVTAPNPDIMGPLLKGLAPLGKLLILSPAGNVQVDGGILIQKGLSVHGWPSGHAMDSEETIEFANLHNVKCLVEKFPLEKAQEAYEHMLSGKVRFRGVLVMD